MNIPTGGGTGDPVLTSFDGTVSPPRRATPVRSAMPCLCQTDQLVCFAGRSFEFMGDVGKFYSLISERSHQLTMRLKLGQMFDHNGTYMDVSFANLLKGMRCFDHSLAVRNPGFPKLGF